MDPSGRDKVVLQYGVRAKGRDWRWYQLLRLVPFLFSVLIGMCFYGRLRSDEIGPSIGLFMTAPIVAVFVLPGVLIAGLGVAKGRILISAVALSILIPEISCACQEASLIWQYGMTPPSILQTRRWFPFNDRTIWHFPDSGWVVLEG